MLSHYCWVYHINQPLFLGLKRLSRPRRWPQRYRALPRFGAAPVAWVAQVSHGAASPAQGIEKYLDITSHIRWIILDISMDDYIPYRLHTHVYIYKKYLWMRNYILDGKLVILTSRILSDMTISMDIRYFYVSYIFHGSSAMIYLDGKLHG